MDFQELFRSLVKEAGARTIYADPISAEGKTIVPVARVRCGFGGGSGKTARQDGEGGGGGGGFVSKPVGFIEISAQGTRFVPIVEPWSVAVAVGVGICLGLLIGRRR